MGDQEKRRQRDSQVYGPTLLYMPILPFNEGLPPTPASGFVIRVALIHGASVPRACLAAIPGNSRFARDLIRKEASAVASGARNALPQRRARARARARFMNRARFASANVL